VIPSLKIPYWAVCTGIAVLAVILAALVLAIAR
jgi:hypothetical protein